MLSRVAVRGGQTVVCLLTVVRGVRIGVVERDESEEGEILTLTPSGWLQIITIRQGLRRAEVFGLVG